jgi:hypothetical protein
MRIGSFELGVVGKVETAEGFVPMLDKETYKLKLGNHSGEYVNIYVSIDGLSVGEFQLRPYQVAELERPISAAQLFNFFSSGSSEAQAVGEAAIGKSDKGLVQVRFVPEKQYTPPTSPLFGAMRGGGDYEETTRSYGTRGGSTTRGASYGAGVTGMTGSSSQRFGQARYIQEDLDRQVTITLRLVIDKTANGPKPLPGRVVGNPVPPPVE